MDNMPDEVEKVAYHRYTKDERLEMYDRMLEQKYRGKSSWDEIADQNDVARSTIRRWRKTDEWRMAEAQWRRIMREEARSDVAMIGQDMVSVLQDLAHNSRSDFTRYNAAAKLLDLFGVGDEIEEQRVDQTNELMKFMERMHRRNQGQQRLVAAGIDMDNVIDAEVKPGGLLPESIVAQNKIVMEERLALQEELLEEQDEDN